MDSYRDLTREQAAELIDRWQGEPAHPGDVVAEGELVEEGTESPGQKAVRETAEPEPAPSSTQQSAGDVFADTISDVAEALGIPVNHVVLFARHQLGWTSVTGGKSGLSEGEATRLIAELRKGKL